MFNHIGQMMESLRYIEPIGGYRQEANNYRTGYSNSGNNSIAGRGHLNLREIARKATRPGSQARRDAYSALAR